MAAQKAGVPVTLVDNSQASLDKGLKFAGNDQTNSAAKDTWTNASQISYLKRTSPKSVLPEMQQTALVPAFLPV